MGGVKFQSQTFNDLYALDLDCFEWA